ncbi:uncharacterized protein LOC143554826 [Bidens hawaiensis]|uniref:uncharacterized protein LOC143554826 n=1 Tax=Bidens hawaiensis TaxID=980011 RepID=UPI00404A5545
MESEFASIFKVAEKTPGLYFSYGVNITLSSFSDHLEYKLTKEGIENLSTKKWKYRWGVNAANCKWEATKKLNLEDSYANSPYGKSYSCFSAPWELDEQQHNPEAKTNSAQLGQPIALEARGMEIVNEEEIVDMTPASFHGLLAIGTLGSVIIPVTPAVDEETSEGVQILNKKLENLTEKELEKDAKENKNMVKECYETPAIIEDEKEQKTTLAISYKRSDKLDKGVKRETRAFHVMKKMLKKLDFTSRCSTTLVFRKSRKIHPQGADTHVNKSHKYEVKKMCYDKEVPSDDDDKETISSNMFAHGPFNMQPAGRKAQWIKTDADYFVLEF